MRAWCMQKRGLQGEAEKQYFIRSIAKTLYQHYETVKLVPKDEILKPDQWRMLRASRGPDIVMNCSKCITETVIGGQEILAPRRTEPGHPSCHDHLTDDFLAISPATGIVAAVSAANPASANLPEAARIADMKTAPDLQRPTRQLSPKRSDGYAGAAF